MEKRLHLLGNLVYTAYARTKNSYFNFSNLNCTIETDKYKLGSKDQSNIIIYDKERDDIFIYLNINGSVKGFVNDSLLISSYNSSQALEAFIEDDCFFIQREDGTIATCLDLLKLFNK